MSKAADNTFILCETSLERIFDQTQRVEATQLVIDSIQTVYSTGNGVRTGIQ